MKIYLIYHNHVIDKIIKNYFILLVLTLPSSLVRLLASLRRQRYSKYITFGMFVVSLIKKCSDMALQHK